MAVRLATLNVIATPGYEANKITVTCISFSLLATLPILFCESRKRNVDCSPEQPILFALSFGFLKSHFSSFIMSHRILALVLSMTKLFTNDIAIEPAIHFPQGMHHRFPRSVAMGLVGQHHQPCLYAMSFEGIVETTALQWECA